ncbi:MAG TPA: fused MFS/spermidine synthase [Terriglobales bacterium]|nr:fused MFS/spermidine synthase [Terriglobales bacterium]
MTRRTLYGLTIFLSAFLLFQVQPILGKYILPWFGGTPAVWTACLLFFQTMLLVGYLYSHTLAVRFSPSSQVAIHTALLASSLAWIFYQAQRWGTPVLPPSAERLVSATHPTLDVLFLLLAAVGVPYFLLSSTGPLLQAWFARAQQASPYRLYALSNAGSLLGLLSYPFAVEPALSLRTQGRMWTWGYVAFVVGCAACAWSAGRSAAPSDPAPIANDSPPARGALLLWAALAACASAMLLATTNQISQEVAVVPFLWVLPLSVYLATLIVCFDAPRWYARRWMKFLMVAALVAPVLLFIGPYAGFLVQLAGFSLILLVVCMVCHGELVRLKPAAQHLTFFYLALSGGAAAGSAFVALLAPRLFPAYWEFHISLWTCCLLAVIVLVRDRQRLFYRDGFGPGFYLALVGLAVLASELGLHAWWQTRNTLEVARNFFGVVAVREDFDYDNTYLRIRVLRHGGITHGLQYQDERLRTQPTAYFVPESGVGLAFASLRSRASSGLRIGVVGLGIGTLAAYGREGDSIRFYEINPEVTRIARGPLFSYLRDAQARVEIVAGDGRLSLEHELTQGSQQFDLLVLDAFTSGAPPVHLLTREAFDLYLAHLAPQGILAVNVSNRALDLRPVVQRAAAHSGLALTWTYLPPAGPFHPGGSWMLLARDPQLLREPPLTTAASPLPPPPANFRQWTDDYSNLFQVLK